MTALPPPELAMARRIAAQMGVDLSNLVDLDPRVEMTLIAFRVRRHVVRLRTELAEHEGKLVAPALAA
jgi:hypothetical protein